MEKRRFAVDVRAYRNLIALVTAIVVVAFAADSAFAAPKDAKARAAFDEGIAAYQKHDYAKAAEAFGRSYGIEADVETLFAWAQSERQQNRCDKAIELYTKLLEAKLPDENKQVVSEKLGECKKLVGATEPDPEPQPQPVQPPVATPAPLPAAPPNRPESRWKDPVGGALVGAGAVGFGVGIYFLISGNSADGDAKAAQTHADAQRFTDKAKSHGRIGVIATAAGSALLIGGIVRYATRSNERTTISGWFDATSGGVVALGRF